MNVEAYLLAYFTADRERGEQIRFAVSEGPRPDAFTPIAGGDPMVVSRVGTGGARDPYVVRDPETGLFTLIATDLRAADPESWWRSVRWGSRGILVCHSRDLVNWTPPRLVEVGPPHAGNVWAPKAFWQDGRWLVFWASAIYASDADREEASHQRIFVSSTRDWRRFSSPSVYLDRGHDVIDVTFAELGGSVLRFSVDQQPVAGDATAGTHVLVEVGRDLFDTAFAPVAVDVGRDDLDRGEGPAVAVSEDGEVFLLIDEFTGDGLHLFSSRDPLRGRFELDRAARLPASARHGSLLPISRDERDRLLEFPAAPR